MQLGPNISLGWVRVRMPHAIYRFSHFGVVREGLLWVFLPMYTVAISHQINFTTNKSS